MFLLSLLFLITFALFIALNLGAAGAFGLGLIILVALWLRHKAEFWPLLLAMVLFWGGAGALGASWGGYFGISRQTPEWGYAVLAWATGYVLGGIGGVLLGTFGVALRRRSELSRIEDQIKSGFANLKSQLSTVGFRQMVRVGAYSLRLTFSKQ